jgi:flagellar basal-body rod modification protein FlgD
METDPGGQTMANPVIGSSRSNIPSLATVKSQLEFKTNQSDISGQTGTKDVNKDMFLQLMVAQLKNQNPLNPMEGTDFLQQLSQISGVEQMVEMRKELEAIHQLLSSSGAN